MDCSYKRYDVQYDGTFGALAVTLQANVDGTAATANGAIGLLKLLLSKRCNIYCCD